MSDSEDNKSEIKVTVRNFSNDIKLNYDYDPYIQQPTEDTLSLLEYIAYFTHNSEQQYLDYLANSMSFTYENIVENKMIDMATQESLEYYKTQERKPNITLNIQPVVWKDEFKDKMCAICKSEFEKKEVIIELACKHLLHDECISEWVKYKSECPVCRSVIDTTDK